jgi:hypothetical protein
MSNARIASFAPIFTATLSKFNDSSRSRWIQAQYWLVECKFLTGETIHCQILVACLELLKHSFHPFGRCSWRPRCGVWVTLLSKAAFSLPYSLYGRVPILNVELCRALYLSTFCKRKPLLLSQEQQTGVPTKQKQLHLCWRLSQLIMQLFRLLSNWLQQSPQL